MDGSSVFLRFSDRRIFGSSDFRPSEGWIDVVTFSFDWDAFQRDGQGEAFVVCTNAPGNLVTARLDRWVIDWAVLEIRMPKRKRWARYKATKLTVSEVWPGDENTSRVLFACKKPTYEYGGIATRH